MPDFHHHQLSLRQRLGMLIVLLVIVAVILETGYSAGGPGAPWLNSPAPGTAGSILQPPRSEQEGTQPAARGKRGKCKKSKAKKKRGKCGKKRPVRGGQDVGQGPAKPTPPPADPTPTTHPSLPPTHAPPPSPTLTPTHAPPPAPTPTPTPTPDPGPTAVLLAAGDIADCDSSGDEATAALLDSLPGTVATLGDLVYESGTASEFAQCYAPSWGRHKGRTRPAVGNHEYLTDGAAGYFGYFGAAAGEPEKGYYSYDLGSWHVVVLNSNCSQAGGCGTNSPQEGWLRQDLAANPTACTLAYWHHPRFSFGNFDDDDRVRALWQALDEAGAEIVLSGHDHNYQRYALLDADGNRETAGIRAFVVGTGGKNHNPLRPPPSTAEAFNDDTFGILQLTLHTDSYDWEFIPVAGETYSDSGSDVCH